MVKARFLVFVLSFCTLQLAQAQVSAAENAVKKAEKRVADKMIEKTFNGLVNKLFGQDSSTVTEDKTVKTDSTVTANSSRFGGLFAAKTIDKSYSFDIALHMEVQTKDKKGNGDPINMIAHYSSDSAYIATEVQDVFNILDFNEMKTYAIVGGRVTVVGLQSFIDKANREARKSKKDDEEDEIKYEYKKTGRTEMIAGYKCEEYTIKTEETDGQVWVAEGIGINPKAYQKTFVANPGMSFPSHEKGIVLKMIIKDLENETTTTMITKDVVKDEVSYDLSKYKATDLSRLKF